MIKNSLLNVLVLMLLAVGCSGVVKETIDPTETPMGYVAGDNPIEIVGVRKVALFPFADYSHQQEFLKNGIWGGNIRILEEITDQLVAHGIAVTVQEDVNTLLVDNNIIQPMANQYLIYGTGGDDKVEFRTKVIGTPEYDLVNVEHSEDMKDEIISIIRDEMALEEAEKPPIQTPVLQGATVGLSREKVVELGERLGVDLIVRGRIIEYGFKEKDTYNPLKRGFLPVLIEPIEDVLLGVAEVKKYESDLEDVDFSRLGEGAGFLFGQKAEDDLEGTWDLMVEHSFGSLANLYPRKKDVSTVVQIRMYAQDAKTGDVLWSNRAETEYIPSTSLSFNGNHPKTMFDMNIKRCVKLLMDDFFRYVSLSGKKKIEMKDSFVGDQGISKIEGLKGKLSENETLMKELQAKIGNLENSKRILLQQIEDKTLITLPNAVLFPSGYATLNKQGVKTLKAISKVLERYTNRAICIEGHTDNIPIGPKIKEKYASNWEISTARAITAMSYMVKNFGFDQSYITV